MRVGLMLKNCRLFSHHHPSWYKHCHCNHHHHYYHHHYYYHHHHHYHHHHYYHHQCQWQQYFRAQWSLLHPNWYLARRQLPPPICGHCHSFFCLLSSVLVLCIFILHPLLNCGLPSPIVPTIKIFGRSAGVVAYMLLSGGVSPFYSGQIPIRSQSARQSSCLLFWK